MLIKSNKIILLNYFLENPTAKNRIRGIESKTKLPLPSITRYLKELKQEKLIKTETIANIKLYSANFGAKEFTLEKKLYNLRKIYSSGLIEHLNKNLNNPLIILFGSYLRGEDVESGDIDLFVQTNKKIDLLEFEQFFKKNIQIFGFSSITDIKNKHLLNNILEGLTLSGKLNLDR